MPIDQNYITENSFPGGGCQTGSFFVELPSGFCERIPDATDIEDARRRALERHAGRRSEKVDSVNRNTKYRCTGCNRTCTDASPDDARYRYIVKCSECGNEDTDFPAL
jgi:rubrerythrin